MTNTIKKIKDYYLENCTNFNGKVFEMRLTNELNINNKIALEIRLAIESQDFKSIEMILDNIDLGVDICKEIRLYNKNNLDITNKLNWNYNELHLYRINICKGVDCEKYCNRGYTKNEFGTILYCLTHNIDPDIFLSKYKKELISYIIKIENIINKLDMKIEIDYNKFIQAQLCVIYNCLKDQYKYKRNIITELDTRIFDYRLTSSLISDYFYCFKYMSIESKNYFIKVIDDFEKGDISNNCLKTMLYMQKIYDQNINKKDSDIIIKKLQLEYILDESNNFAYYKINKILIKNIFTKTEEEIINYIIDNDIKEKTLDNILIRIEDAFPFLKDIIEMLKRIIETYDEYLYNNIIDKREKKKKENEDKKYKEMEKLFPKAKEIIEDFIKYGKSSNIYTRDHNIDKKLFDQYKESVKLFDSKLYEEYSTFSKKISNQVYMSLINNSKKILGLITNGIEENGEIREFNLLDYYLITSEPLDKFCDFIAKTEGFTQNDLRIVKTFLAKNKKKMIYFSYQRTFAECKWSYNGHEFTKSERDQIFKFMSIKSIPFYTYLYKEIGRRYVDGRLNIFI